MPGHGSSGIFAVFGDVCGERNRIQKFKVAGCAGKNHSVFESKVSVVDNAEKRQFISTTGFPQNVFVCGESSVRIRFKERQSFVFGGRPGCAFVGAHFERDVQFSGLNGVYVGFRLVGEPSVSRTRNKADAQSDRRNCGNDDFLEVFILFLFLLIISWGLKFWG